MSGQDKDIKSSLKFNDYIVKNIIFKYNEGFNGEAVKISFNITRKVLYKNEDNNSAEVTLFVDIFDDKFEDNQPFYMHIEITGYFEVDDIQSEIGKHLIKYNSVAILFPYVRALITSYTANSNVPPLILPPINITKMIDEEESENKKQ